MRHILRRWANDTAEALTPPPAATTATAPPARPASDPADENLQTHRLARLIEACLGGDLAGAELELHEWARQDDCPPAARVLLSSLLCRRGDHEGALDVLRIDDDPSSADDPALLQQAMAIHAVSGVPGMVHRLARVLHHRHGTDVDVAQWLALTQPAGWYDLAEPSDSEVAQLATELASSPAFIPTLVAGQRLCAQPRQIALLRRALTRAAADLEGTTHLSTVYTALAELAMMARDADDARRWAHRGLRINAYSAALALVLAQVSDDPNLGQPASTVLADVAARFPDYPDVQAALIRRELSDGRARQARLRLDQWLARQPDHPMAQQLRQELAA